MKTQAADPHSLQLRLVAVRQLRDAKLLYSSSSVTFTTLLLAFFILLKVFFFFLHVSHGQRCVCDRSMSDVTDSVLVSVQAGLDRSGEGCFSCSQE